MFASPMLLPPSSLASCGKIDIAEGTFCRYWRFDWFGGADNPNFDFQQVQCPGELTAISGCTREDDGSFPGA